MSHRILTPTEAPSIRHRRTPWRVAPRSREFALFAVSAVCMALMVSGCGGSVEARLAEVQALHDAGDFSSTIEPLRKVLASEPDNSHANYLYGLALVQTRQPSLSIWPLRKAAESTEYAVPAGVLLASTLVGMEGFEEALRAADGVIAVEPDNLFAIQVRANAHLGMGAHEEAMIDADRVIALEPELINGYALKSMAMTLADRVDEAEASIRKLIEVATAKDNKEAMVRGCVGLVALYRTKRSDQVETGMELASECLEKFPTEPIVLSEAESVFDAAKQPDTATDAYRKAVETKPEEVGLHFLLANRLGAQGKTEDAEAVLVEAADLFKEARAYDQLARFYQTQGDYDKAKQATQQALDAEGADDEGLRFRQAELLIELDDIAGAEAVAAELTEKVFRQLITGRIHVARGEDEQALAVFEAALVSWPNNAAARFLAGATAERLGLLPKALSHYRESLRADSEATDASLGAARLHLANGQYEDALQMAVRQLENRKTSVSEAHILAARAATALERYEVARRHLAGLASVEDRQLTRVVELAAVERAAGDAAKAAKVVTDSGIDLTDPANIGALRSVVDDWNSTGKSAEAVAKLDAAVAAHPDSAELRDVRARVRYLGGDIAGGRADFEGALAADANYAPALSGLARIAVEEGKLDEALVLLDRAAQADPSDADSGHLAAQILMGQGKRDEAAARLRKVLEGTPGHAFAANDLAWMLAEQGDDLDYALEISERASRLDGRPEILDTLGYVQHKSGDDLTAIASYRRALEATPDAASTRYRLGVSLSAIGRADEALEAFRKAVDSGTFPESEDARAQIARLEASQ